ncbi:hypothetical protein BDN70DRAFT_153370 [Pholiota conissans]|uniref:Uncharacterized protein n=1 Tax=Pholiota conissans TaxID=109636 RepID=A0A9P5YVW5_9AGAR|nr:hypothetical protein BDN70DRAFT_153370 [Pholiota conissans]
MSRSCLWAYVWTHIRDKGVISVLYTPVLTSLLPEYISHLIATPCISIPHRLSSLHIRPPSSDGPLFSFLHLPQKTYSASCVKFNGLLPEILTRFLHVVPLENLTVSTFTVRDLQVAHCENTSLSYLDEGRRWGQVFEGIIAALMFFSLVSFRTTMGRKDETEEEMEMIFWLKLNYIRSRAVL